MYEVLEPTCYPVSKRFKKNDKRLIVLEDWVESRADHFTRHQSISIMVVVHFSHFHRNYTQSRKKKKDLNNVIHGGTGSTWGHNFYMGTQNG